MEEDADNPRDGASRPPSSLPPSSLPPDDDEGAERPSLRPGRESSTPRGGPSHNHRILVAVLWVIVQVVLIITADRRADGAFGFRMFSESSSIRVALFREVDGPLGPVRVHVDGGVWSAHDAEGRVHRLTWYDRVRIPFWAFDQEVHASYGAATQLARLQSALDDVAAHYPNDAETRRFLLEVTVRRNGREPVVHRLSSRARAVVAPREAPPAELDGGT